MDKPWSTPHSLDQRRGLQATSILTSQDVDISGIAQIALRRRAKYLPILVESSLALLSNMLSPDCLQGSETTGSLNISNHSNADNWRSLNDSTSLDDLLLVDLRARPIDIAYNMGHASLVSHEAGKMHRFTGIILGEALDAPSKGFGTLLREKSLGSVSWRLKLSVRLK